MSDEKPEAKRKVPDPEEDKTEEQLEKERKEQQEQLDKERDVQIAKKREDQLAKERKGKKQLRTENDRVKSSGHGFVSSHNAAHVSSEHSSAGSANSRTPHTSDLGEGPSSQPVVDCDAVPLVTATNSSGFDEENGPVREHGSKGTTNTTESSEMPTATLPEPNNRVIVHFSADTTAKKYKFLGLTFKKPKHLGETRLVVHRGDRYSTKPAEIVTETITREGYSYLIKINYDPRACLDRFTIHEDDGVFRCSVNDTIFAALDQLHSWIPKADRRHLKHWWLKTIEKSSISTTTTFYDWMKGLFKTPRPPTWAELMSEKLARPYTPLVANPFPDDRQMRLVPWCEFRNLKLIENSDNKKDTEPNTTEADKRLLPQEPNVPEKRSEKSDDPKVEAETIRTPSIWVRFMSLRKRNRQKGNPMDSKIDPIDVSPEETGKTDIGSSHRLRLQSAESGSIHGHRTESDPGSSISQRLPTNPGSSQSHRSLSGLSQRVGSARGLGWSQRSQSSEPGTNHSQRVQSGMSSIRSSQIEPGSPKMPNAPASFMARRDSNGENRASTSTAEQAPTAGQAPTDRTGQWVVTSPYEDDKSLSDSLKDLVTAQIQNPMAPNEQAQQKTPKKENRF